MPNAVTSADPIAVQPQPSSLQTAQGLSRPAPYWYFNPFAWIVLLALKAYQICVPARYKPKCRFTPSCSLYMALAIRKYGVAAGVRLGWHRFRRCVGFGPRGEDWP
jgi:putative component of membrane protein insertase Oxa1/YidC/SpoIIIJ protein YidD